MKTSLLFILIICTYFSNAQRRPTPPAGQLVTILPFEEALCPGRLLKGDREFDGNGPWIKSDVKIFIVRDSTEIWANIYFWAQETKGDMSTVEGIWRKKIYEAPYGMRIKKIHSDNYSLTELKCVPEKADIFKRDRDSIISMMYFYGGSFVSRPVLEAHAMTDNPIFTRRMAELIQFSSSGGNKSIRVPAKQGRLVRFFHFVGDTGGLDITDDDNCNDDTRIVKIEFFPIRLELVNRVVR